MNWLETGKTASQQTLRVNKIIFEPLAFFLTIVLFGWYLLVPQWQAVGVAGTEVKRLDNQKALLESRRTQLGSLTRQLAGRSAEIVKLEGLLPTNSSPSGLYYLLEQMAASSGLVGASVTIASEPKEVIAGDRVDSFSGNYELHILEVQARGTGTIDQLQGFLELIESSSRLMETKGMDVSSAPSGLLAFTLQIQAYAYAPVAVESKKTQ